MIRHFRISVKGRVQGVGFRYAARTKARSLNLKGWVENELDGSVSIAVQGDEKCCGDFIRWCRNGTGYSWVEKIDILEKKPEILADFSIRH